MNEYLDKELKQYIEDLSSSKGTPGGGNALGITGSLGCALLLMSIRIAILKKDPENQKYSGLADEVITIQEKFLHESENDSMAFKEVLKHWSSGGKGLENALYESAAVSFRIFNLAVELTDMIYQLEIHLFKNIITDVAISLEFAGAVVRGALMNYKINAVSLTDKEKLSDIKEKIESLNKRFEENRDEINKKVELLI